MELTAYKNLFNNLSLWVFATAVCHFVVFLLAFVLLCFAFSSMDVLDDSHSNHDVFISKFEKYFVLTSAVLLLVPYLFSFLLTFGLLTKYDKLSHVWLKGTLVFTPVFSLGLLSSGIYLSVEGSYVGYITIPISLVFCAFMVHSILLIYCYLRKDVSEEHSVHSQSDRNSEERSSVAERNASL